jgi:hypothetical protein
MITDDGLVSTDDFAGWLANQTNLALKGIIGIRAMSGIAEAVDNEADAEHYRVSGHIPSHDYTTPPKTCIAS